MREQDFRYSYSMLYLQYLTTDRGRKKHDQHKWINCLRNYLNDGKASFLIPMYQRRCSRIVPGVNLWLKWSLFYSINESVSYLYISAAEPACSACATTTSACCSTCVVCRFVNGRKMQWLTAARWLTAVM